MRKFRAEWSEVNAGMWLPARKASGLESPGQPRSDISLAWKPTRRQEARLFAQLGLCLHVYQLMELRLKTLLPHFVVPGTDTTAPGEGFENWRAFLDSKQTLGLLVRRLHERTTHDQPELVEEMWRTVVDDRNEVVHHFAEQPFARMSSRNECRQAFEFLRERRLRALPLLDQLQGMLEGLVTVLGSISDDDQPLIDDIPAHP